MTKAEGTFSVDTWDPTSIDEAEGAKLARVHLTKTFKGDLTVPAAPTS